VASTIMNVVVTNSVNIGAGTAAMQVYNIAEWFTGDSTGNGMI